jgi:hypothetical protein
MPDLIRHPSSRLDHLPRELPAPQPVNAPAAIDLHIQPQRIGLASRHNLARHDDAAAHCASIGAGLIGEAGFVLLTQELPRTSGPALGRPHAG